MKTAIQSEITTKYGKTIISITLLAVTMILTNPPQNSYVDYAATKLEKEVKNAICIGPKLPDLLSALGSVMGSICKITIEKGIGSKHPLIQAYIDNETTRQNFMILSVYTTKVPGFTFRSIGALGNFITFSNK